MKIIDAESCAFIQAMCQDNRHDVMRYIRERSSGVDKLAMIRRVSEDDAKTTITTFWFKGHNGKQDVRYTFSTDVI